tara:strand:+ start:189 stop:692 length:504 start_codon:yes stop_codon:yes gene_type:complete
MITIYLTIAVFITIFYVSDIYCHWEHNFWRVFANSLTGIVVGFLVGFTITFILPAETEVNIYNYDIETLQDNSSVSGDFFLGSGNIEGNMKYVFYYKTNGGFKMKQIDYDDVIIKYSETRKEVIEHKEEMVSDSWINNFAYDASTVLEYEVFVPKGTIRSNFNLDAQ